jgi:hypothetical protein
MTARRTTSPAAAPDARATLVARHLRAGWLCVLGFAALGLAIEGLNGFKVGWYVGVASETRRLMWTLAHAHGVLLGVLNLGFAATVALRAPLPSRRFDIASRCLLAASVLLPAGFLLGGAFIYAGDPGFGILLVPVGGVLLIAAVIAVLVG